MGTTVERESFSNTVDIENLVNEAVTLMVPFPVPESEDSELVVTIGSVITYTGTHRVELNRPSEIAEPSDFALIPDGLKTDKLSWIYNLTTGNCVAIVPLSANAKIPLTFTYSVDRPKGKPFYTK